MAIAVSACVICKNEAEKVRTCLDSLTWCTDIVVVDSGSTDATVQIARQHPAKPRVIHHDWQGYNQQREFAVSACANPWVLALDADEECSPKLARDIQNISESAVAQIAMFETPRKNFIAGRFVRCWSPDFQMRLIHRDRVEWDQTSLPEVRRPIQSFTIAKLGGAILHNRLTPYREVDFNDGPVMAERARLLASRMAATGKRATLFALLTRPPMTFLKYYFLRGAFLQGRFGLIIAYKTTIGVMLKYSVLYAEQNLQASQTADPKITPPQ